MTPSELQTHARKVAAALPPVTPEQVARIKNVINGATARRK